MEKFTSRKFVLVVFFVATFCANFAFKWGVSTEDLIVLGGIVGVYNAANVAAKIGTAKAESEEAYEALKSLYDEAVCELSEDA